MRHLTAATIRTSVAIAAVAASLIMASPPASAQGYFVNGHAASAAEVQYLSTHGMPPGNWRIDGWGIGPADNGFNRQLASSDTEKGKCWYVLDVPLGDCGTTSNAIASRDATPGTLPPRSLHAELAAAESGSRMEAWRHSD
jgi:hypothetical protein